MHPIYDDFVDVSWSDVQDGDRVWIDNYEKGEKPLANPLISGPYLVVSVDRRTLRTLFGKLQRTMMHYPNNLLKSRE